jgi:hypothetical protein
VPTGGREVCLHACGACSFERVDDGQADVSCQIGRLVEPTLTAARMMERDRDHTIGALQYIRTTHLQERSQRPRERPTALIFPRVNDRAKRAFVHADGSGFRHRTLQAAASGASA